MLYVAVTIHVVVSGVIGHDSWFMFHVILFWRIVVSGIGYKKVFTYRLQKVHVIRPLLNETSEWT